jgi:hypothetical protein
MKIKTLIEYALALKITYTNYITKYYYFNNIIIIFGLFIHSSYIDCHHPKTLNSSNVNKVPNIPPKITSKIEWISESTLLCATIIANK